MTRKYSHLAACPTYTLLVPAPESGYILNGLTALPPVTLCMARYAALHHRRVWSKVDPRNEVEKIGRNVSASPVFGFGASDFFQQLAGAPGLSRGAGQEIIQTLGGDQQADMAQLRGQIMI